MTCISCVAIRPYEEQAFLYADRVFRVLAPNCKNALLAGLITLVAWELLVKGILKSNLDVRNLAYKLSIGLFYYALLEKQGMVLEYIIEPIKASTVQIAKIIIEQGNFVAISEQSSISLINEALEKAIWQVFEYSENLFARGGIFNPGAIIDGLLLCAPLIFAWGYFAFVSIWFTLLIAVIYAIVPVLIIFSIFPATRSLLFSGIKLVLQGAFRFFFALLFIGLCISSIKSFCEHNWFSGEQQNNSALLFTGSFLACFLNGVITCKLLNYTNSMAATLVGGLYHVPAAGFNIAHRMGNLLMQGVAPKKDTRLHTKQVNKEAWTTGNIDKGSLTTYKPEAPLSLAPGPVGNHFADMASSVSNQPASPASKEPGNRRSTLSSNSTLKTANKLSNNKAHLSNTSTIYQTQSSIHNLAATAPIKTDSATSYLGASTKLAKTSTAKRAVERMNKFTDPVIKRAREYYPRNKEKV